MKGLLKLLKKIDYINSPEDIISADEPFFLKMLAKYYNRRVKAVERASEKKSFFCKSWKVYFVSFKPAFMKVRLWQTKSKNQKNLNLAQPLLFQQFIFDSKIFKANGTVLPLSTTINNRFILLIKGPHQILAIALSDYLEKTRQIGKKERFLELAELLATLHLKSKGMIGDSIGRVLVHGDFARENILINQQGKLWLTDWENLRVDWPEYDLACFVRDGMDAYGMKIDDPVNKLFLKVYEEYSGLKINYERLGQYLKSFKKI